MAWERVHEALDGNGPYHVWRYPVPGGWIYVHCNYAVVGTVFVPEPNKVTAGHGDTTDYQAGYNRGFEDALDDKEPDSFDKPGWKEGYNRGHDVGYGRGFSDALHGYDPSPSLATKELIDMLTDAIDNIRNGGPKDAERRIRAAINILEGK